ncbi:MAG: hypothetical protein HY702_03335 [Gemmatimonadetes bacterium]|nr:hypothetical protein [Gemmatimonadota bacterium]
MRPRLPPLVRFLYRRLGDRDQAEELAQEAFVRLIERRPRGPRAWLYAVAANLARDAARADVRRAAIRPAIRAVEGAWSRCSKERVIRVKARWVPGSTAEVRLTTASSR